MTDFPRSRMRGADALRAGALGLRSRRLRTALSALGIAIGITAVVAVVGVSASQEAGLLDELDRLGTNLLTAIPGQTLFGKAAELPSQSVGMAARLEGVTAATATSQLSVNVYRNSHIPAAETASIAVFATRTDLLTALQATLAHGTFLNAATSRYPATVLGSAAAQRLGISGLAAPVQLWLGGHWFEVVGILNAVTLAPEIDNAVLVGDAIAKQILHWDGAPGRIYLRADPDQVVQVQRLLAAQVYPAHPDQVQVSRPSDALAARVVTQSAFTSLLLGLGAVALLVGAVGIGNVMVIAVLERRSEVGLRRALGATRRHIAMQFLTESVLVSGIGGICGVLLGIVATEIYALQAGSAVVVPLMAVAGGVGAALLVGAIAGLYPSARAARLSPTEALRSV